MIIFLREMAVKNYCGNNYLRYKIIIIIKIINYFLLICRLEHAEKEVNRLHQENMDLNNQVMRFFNVMCPFNAELRILT